MRIQRVVQLLKIGKSLLVEKLIGPFIGLPSSVRRKKKYLKDSLKPRTPSENPLGFSWHSKKKKKKDSVRGKEDGWQLYPFIKK